MHRLLVTGSAGFIGSHFVDLALSRGYAVTSLDLLTYAGNLANLAAAHTHPHHTFIQGDIADRATVDRALTGCTSIVHFAAESHVDNSIIDASPFIHTNILGTQTLLDAARAAGIERFLHVSTDEVYGALSLDAPDTFTEETPLSPRSPYAASKAASDLLVRAAHITHALPTIISRCSNNYGTRQYPEKLIPLTITRALRDQSIPVYGDGRYIRDWLHVTDHCTALLAMLERGVIGETYNVGSDNEVANLDLVKLLLKILKKPESLITFVEDRKGHDRRYATNSTKLQTTLNWHPATTDFEKALTEVAHWYTSRP